MGIRYANNKFSYRILSLFKLDRVAYFFFSFYLTIRKYEAEANSYSLKIHTAFFLFSILLLHFIEDIAKNIRSDAIIPLVFIIFTKISSHLTYHLCTLLNIPVTTFKIPMQKILLRKLKFRKKFT